MMQNKQHFDMKQSIRHVAVFFVSLLSVLFIYVSYVQVIQHDFLTNHPLNRRLAYTAAHTPQGDIVDRHGEVLAHSELKADKQGYQRQYPYGAAVAHVVGYSSATYGKTGIESLWQAELTGRANPLWQLGAISQLAADQGGHSLTLTLDMELQQAAYKALGNRRGSIVVMVPQTGEILAMASTPSFNPNRLDAQWKDISNDSSSPLLNRATHGLYPPGSILKVMTAEAALHEKITDTKRVFNCNGQLEIGKDYVLRESNHQVHGKLVLEDALAVSCNTTFGTLGLELGRKRLAAAFERFGFQKELPDWEEAACRLPDFGQLSDGDLAQTAIGQSSLLVTPLRMAMMASAFANHGVMMQPYLVSKVSNAQGNVLRELKPQRWLTATDSQQADLVKAMMQSVVKEGTGTQAALGGISVAGKTGTAENPHGEPHAWFIGIAPAKEPQIVIVVMVENGGSGGAVAAPIARQILSKALH